MNTCYIVGAGELYNLAKPDKTDLLIAADGGYDHLISHHLTPNLLIGDLDSIREVPEDVEILRFPERKDETDMLLAFNEGYARGFREFRIYGGTGGREDHTYANYSLLLYAKNRGARAVLSMKGFNAEVLRDETVSVMPEHSGYFSLFALGGEARVTIRGALFDAEDITLTPEFPLGVSNRYRAPVTQITVTHGTVLAFL
ncbi:MAG: thiamine diphosphokinase [Clostridia bacterium]|nr:thiamine diphosphokinase [Clostridia bacterium]